MFLNTKFSLMSRRSSLMLISVVLLLLVGYLYTWKISQSKFSGQLSEDVFSTIRIAPIDEALTFAVDSSGDVLLVVGTYHQGVEAINLSELLHRHFLDAVDAYHTVPKSELLAHAQTDTSKRYPWQDLIVPVKVAQDVVAVGTNYRAHALEVNHEGEPFLFPKLSIPTAWNAVVKNGTRLDHEVEICFVPLSEYAANAQAEPKLGYLLCGDYTDRWLLVKDINTDGDMGRTGFALAKGGETRLPVGALLVIPEKADFNPED